MQYRAPHGKVLIRWTSRELERGDDGIAAVKTSSGLYLPARSATRDVPAVGELVSLGRGIPMYSFLEPGVRVLFNKWAARQVEDDLWCVRITDVLAFDSTNDGDWCPLDNVIWMDPIPEAGDTTAGGILLTETFRSALNGGLDIETGETLQYGVACVRDVGWRVSPEIEPEDWVLFSYRHVVYHGESIFVRDDGLTILAGMPSELVKQILAERKVA